MNLSSIVVHVVGVVQYIVSSSVVLDLAVAVILTTVEVSYLSLVAVVHVIVERSSDTRNIRNSM